jgi:polyisoprenyl-teichoic acid--peptidoglycan teichoic acid transferase
VTRPRELQVGTLSARQLPPRLDPRAGRPTRASQARPAVRGASAAAGGPALSFGRVLGLTTIGALLPGTAFLAAGYRRVGWLLLAALAALVGVGAWLATAGQHQAIRMAVSPTGLLIAIVVAVGLAVGWALVVISGYRVLAPASTTTGQHVVGGVLVALLALGIAAPAFEAAHLAAVQRSLVTGLFGDDVESATVPTGAAGDPWGGKDRVNVLLLGGDGGDGRTGVRTDTVIVASIDTVSGATTTFSLPRNLEELPFPDDSPLSDAYPDGFWAGSESESLLNAVYRNGPTAHPDILGPTDNPGADFLKLGVGEALGLTIDYYVLVNLDGFSQLIDALGGITVNVNYYVPVGGDPGTGALPSDYIAPGPNQHMDGERALHYARGRFGLSDYQRMDRQRCMINAIVGAADPMTLITRYQEIATTTQDIVSTDIPQAVVGDFADLALKVKGSGIQSVVFDNTVIRPAYPDFDKIRTVVQDALLTTSAATSTPTPTAPDNGGASSGGGATSDGGTDSDGGAASDGGADSGDSTGGAESGDSEATVDAPASDSEDSSALPVDNAANACAYDPVQAQKALDEGMPPTR